MAAPRVGGPETGGQAAPTTVAVRDRRSGGPCGTVGILGRHRRVGTGPTDHRDRAAHRGRHDLAPGGAVVLDPRDRRGGVDRPAEVDPCHGDRQRTHHDPHPRGVAVDSDALATGDRYPRGVRPAARPTGEDRGRHSPPDAEPTAVPDLMDVPGRAGVPHPKAVPDRAAVPDLMGVPGPTDVPHPKAVPCRAAVPDPGADRSCATLPDATALRISRADPRMAAGARPDAPDP